MPFQAGGAGVTTLSDLTIDPIADNATKVDDAALDEAVRYCNFMSAGGVARVYDHSNLSISRAASIFDHSYLSATKGASVLDNPNLSGGAKAGRRHDIMFHSNLSKSKFNDIVAESAYGAGAGDVTDVKGIACRVEEKGDFHFKTETPDHAYWHRMYNTPAAFETVYQDYTTSMEHKGTTPSKSAPNTADPNPQPGACWSVSMLPDGTQVGGFAPPGTDPMGITWDGTYLWSSDNVAGYIYQLDTAGNPTGGGFASPGPDPYDLSWDGEYLWNVDRTANFIYQLDTAGNPTGGGFAPPASDPIGVTWDGTYLWHIDNTALYIYQLDTAGNSTGGGFAVPTSEPFCLTWDGTYLWWTNSTPEYVYQFKTDGTQVGGFAPPATEPIGRAWDGKYLWGVDNVAAYVYQLGNAGNFDVNYRIFAK